MRSMFHQKRYWHDPVSRMALTGSPPPGRECRQISATMLLALLRKVVQPPVYCPVYSFEARTSPLFLLGLNPSLNRQRFRPSPSLGGFVHHPVLSQDSTSASKHVQLEVGSLSSELADLPLFSQGPLPVWAVCIVQIVARFYSESPHQSHFLQQESTIGDDFLENRLNSSFLFAGPPPPLLGGVHRPDSVHPSDGLATRPRHHSHVPLRRPRARHALDALLLHDHQQREQGGLGPFF